MWVRALLLLLFGLVGILVGQRPAQGASPAAGREVVAGADCNLCHTIPTVSAAPRTVSCSGCHLWFKAVAANPEARLAAMRVFPKWERYERNIHSYMTVPTLGAAMARLEPAWVERYLADPYDLRPHMSETMVRVGLSPTQRAEIAAWFGENRVSVPATPAPDPAQVATGAALFQGRACGGCHTFGALVTTGALPLAPDLRHTRDRLSPDMAVAWIQNPQSVSAEATMPALGLSRDEAIAIRDYLYLSDPQGVVAATALPALPVIDRPVSYAEIEERVIGKICVHCHMEPSRNEGRAGPGNAGGFGWPATGVELQTPAGVAAHGPAIVAAMLRRREEAARDVVVPGQIPASLTRPALPGMPLGLPPIPDEDIALVAAWVAQGAKPPF